MPRYVPESGDFVIVSFDPQSGHEQKGRRPALVISNRVFNESTGLAIVCPVTRSHRSIPFHVSLPSTSSLKGFIMVEQVKSIDYKNRKTRFVEKAPKQIMDQVLAILDACLNQEV